MRPISLRRFIALGMICLSTVGCLVIWATEPIRRPKARPKDIHSDDILSYSFFQRPVLTSKCTRQLQFWTNSNVNGYSDDAIRFHCPGVPCEASIIANTNISTTKVSDGVVFFPEAKWSWKKMHSARPRGQKWVFFSRESPSMISPGVIPPKKYYNDSYDYIMTYRQGSDFLVEFGHYDETRPEVRADDDRNWATKKKNIVIGPAADYQFATWQRGNFIKELQEFVPIDTYEACIDSKPCTESEGFEEKVRSYKFSLALDISRCRDFITEQFFVSLASGTVPIVDGPAREDYERVGPPNSFIHVNDFTSVHELADYIKLLDGNDELYNRFFDWKKLGTVVSIKMADLFATENICPIFLRMHEDEMKIGTDVTTNRKVPDWDEWWWNSCSY
eukprot:XP_011672105.1 PREDICTED: glycoprotein 3-alpha-L-fucosyltransferase A-like [Strongylocentrotus purpuratus]